MLDKNPKSRDIFDKFDRDVLSVILCDEPFSKMAFLSHVIDSSTDPVIFVDMDLLYSGYTRSHMIKTQPFVSIVCPSIGDWRIKFAEIMRRVVSKRTHVIVDSLNGLYSSLDLDSIRLVNACIMMLAVAGRDNGSSIMVTCMARKREKEWVLAPGGRQLINCDLTGTYHVGREDDHLTVYEIGNDGSFMMRSSLDNIKTAL